MYRRMSRILQGRVTKVGTINGKYVRGSLREHWSSTGRQHPQLVPDPEG